MKQEVLELALEAFWTKIAELHPERESQDFTDGGSLYDLERWAQHAYEIWLEMNKPTYYVQRTVTLVVKITGVETPEEAEAEAASIDDPTWFTDSLDTENEYFVLDESGKVCG